MTEMEGADRARALLRVSRYGDDVTEGAADFPSAALGADGVIAYAWRTNSVRAAVYSFDDQAAAQAADDTVRADGLSGRKVATTINGALLMVASAAEDDLAGQELLGALRSNFAGRERDRE